MARKAPVQQFRQHEPIGAVSSGVNGSTDMIEEDEDITGVAQGEVEEEEEAMVEDQAEADGYGVFFLNSMPISALTGIPFLPPSTMNSLSISMDEPLNHTNFFPPFSLLASSTPTSSLTWIAWFCSLPGHEYFCEVAEDFIEDDFNLTGLNALVPFWKEAMEMVLDVEPGGLYLALVLVTCFLLSAARQRMP